MDKKEAVEKLNARFESIKSSQDKETSTLISNAREAYAKKWGKKMDVAKEAVLMQSIQQYTKTLLGKGMTREQIASAATADISKVDNPIAMLYNLMSILIPNFAYTEVCAMQPLPTKKSPMFYPTVVANTARGGIAKDTPLFGSTNWNNGTTYTTNKLIEDGTDSGATLTKEPIVGTVVVEMTLGGSKLFYAQEQDGSFKKKNAEDPITISVSGKTVTIGGASGATDVKVSYRYDWATYANGSEDPIGQITLKWESKEVMAHPYRLRSTYQLDNFYEAKNVLGGYDIDGILATTLGGLINKEISGNVFDDMAKRADASYTWNKAVPSGVAWALHRLSVIDDINGTSLGLYHNVRRSAANYAIVGRDWIQAFGNLGTDMYTGTGYANGKIPLGPHVAGTLKTATGDIKVIFNDDYDPTFSLFGYKADDTDASYGAGVFIGLYSTAPIAKDDLECIQGAGTQMGSVKLFDNSLASLVMVNE